MFDSMVSMACRASAEITHKYLSNVNYTLTLFHGVCVSAAASTLAFTSHVFRVCVCFAIPLGVSITLSRRRNGTDKTKRVKYGYMQRLAIHAPTYDSYQLFIYYVHVKWKNLLEAIA